MARCHSTCLTPQFFTLFRWHVLRYVMRHKLLAGLNVLSVALGVAVYLSIQIANRSANESFAGGVDLVAGKAHLEIRGNVDESIWPAVQKLPGVAATTGTIEGIVTVPSLPGEYLRLIGIDIFTSAPFRTFEIENKSAPLDLDAWLGQPGSIAITGEFAKRHRLKIGDPIDLVVNTRTARAKIVALMETRDSPADSRFAAIDIGWAQELFETQGWLTSIQIRAGDATEAPRLAAQLQKVLPVNLKAEPPRQRSYQMQTMLGAFQLNLTALSLVSLLVGAFLVYNTVYASVTRRQVELGVLRALGASRLEIRSLFLGEACVLGLVGVLLGSFGGIALARIMIGAVERTVSSLYILLRIEHSVLSPWHFVAGAGLGLSAVIVGAWIPAAEASNVDPIGTLSLGSHADRSETRRSRWHRLAILCLLLGAGACWLSLRSAPAPLAFAGAFFVLCGFALCAPLGTIAFARVLRPVSRTSVVFRAAVDHLIRSVHRHAVTVAALSIAVAMSVGLTVMIHSFRESVNDWVNHGVVADLFVAPASNETIGLSATVPREAIDWLRKQPGVDSVDTFRETTVTLRWMDAEQEAILAVVDGRYRENLRFEGGRSTERMQRVFRGEAVAVTESFARKFRVRADDTLRLVSPTRVEEIPIAGVYADYTRDQGVILMSYSRYAPSWGASGAQSLAVYLRPNADLNEVDAAFRREFSGQGEFIVYSNRSLRQRIFAIFDQTFAVTYVLRSIALIVAMLGIFLAVTTLVAERQRETGMLRAIGATRLQVAGMFVTEAGLLGVTASALGIIAGLALAMILTWVVNPAFFGWTIQMHLPWAALMTMPLWVLTATIIAAWIPAWGAAPVSIVESIREE